MKIFEDLAAARQNYENAKTESDAARRKEIEALNRLNEAQKTVEAEMEKLRKEHPSASDWGSRGRRGVGV